MSNIGFGSNILQRLLEKYLYIGYTEIHVYEKDKKIEIHFYRGITRTDLSEPHLNVFMSFLRKYGVTNFYSEKITISGNPHDANFYWKCTLYNITADELAGLIRLTKGGTNENS
ncbi:hypothetical protein IKN40_08725 [bacterium]|nr:hypothetical protein [Clostridia bacterium]MBR4617937.1 hypothetical protein [Bacilli bacterium]MBR6908502.1 hypothetical protein [bacterium]